MAILKKRRKAPRGSKGMKSYIFPSVDEPPTAWGSMLGDVMYFDNRHSVPGEVDKRHAREYCDDTFDWYDWDDINWLEDRAREYLSEHGALVAPIDGGALVAGHDEIVAHFGEDTPKTRKQAMEVLQEEARTYRMWAEGDIYGYSIRDVEDEDAEREPEYVEDYHALPDGRIVDELWGIYGMYEAEQEARDAYDRAAPGTKASANSKSGHWYEDRNIDLGRLCEDNGIEARGFGNTCNPAPGIKVAQVVGMTRGGLGSWIVVVRNGRAEFTAPRMGLDPVNWPGDFEARRSEVEAVCRSLARGTGPRASGQRRTVKAGKGGRMPSKAKKPKAQPRNRQGRYAKRKGGRR